jgi:hypothetical protein
VSAPSSTSWTSFQMLTRSSKVEGSSRSSKESPSVLSYTPTNCYQSGKKKQLLKRIPLPKLNVAKPSLPQIECYCHFQTTIIEETTVRSCETCSGGFQTRQSGLGGTNGLARNRSKHTRTSQNSHLCGPTWNHLGVGHVMPIA